MTSARLAAIALIGSHIGEPSGYRCNVDEAYNTVKEVKGFRDGPNYEGSRARSGESFAGGSGCRPKQK